jgi:Carbohydrate esterase, sialic acid-specific acetylesterase
MMKKVAYRNDSILTIVTLAALLVIGTYAADKVDNAPAKQKKLKVILMMGQSNMVGYFNPRTAWYLTQPIYLPPSKTATARSQDFDWDCFYWGSIRFATGSEEFKAKGKALLDERNELRGLWRDRVYNDKTGYKNDWKEWKKEWGPRPGKDGEGWRSDMQRFLHQKAHEAGLYKRMAEYIDSPENKLPPSVAFELMAKRDEPIADDLKRLHEIFLKGTKPEDFDRLDEALKTFGKVTVSNRADYAELLRKTVNLPIAERTSISAYGEVAGKPTENEFDFCTDGRLSIGYAKWATSSGPEYPFGITFERLVDGPVLIIKCAVGGTSLDQNWRPPSLATKEKPMGPLLKRSLEHIKKALADPGKYHPDYNPKEGYEIAGFVWFQGWNDAGNKEYGNQLVALIKDLRKELKAPEMKVVCGLLGHVGWKLNTFDGDVNRGMYFAAKHPDLKGTVDVVNTVKYMPIELGLLGSVKAAYGTDSDEYKEAERIIKRATSKDATHYFGAAKFGYLTGDAMARKMANLLKDGEPTIFKEAEEILGTSDLPPVSRDADVETKE